MIKVKYDDLVKETSNLIKNNEFIGFDIDYYLIQVLLSKWKPSTVLEIGTCTGNGSRIIRNTLPDSKIYTMDINPNCGKMCPDNVERIISDSMIFNYRDIYPIECWFIDGEHSYKNVFYETKQAIKSKAKYIIYHDADIDDVYNGIINAIESNEYELYQVINPPYIYSSTNKPITRIAYAIKK